MDRFLVDAKLRHLLFSGRPKGRSHSFHGPANEDNSLFRAYTKEARPGYNIREWIEHAIRCPVKTEVQADGRIRKWAWITAVGRYLRVILLEDGETVHNAFFDRSFTESPK